MPRTKCCLEQQIAKKVIWKDNLRKKTRPKGARGQDTDQAGTFLGVLNHENRPETLKNYKNRPGTMKNQPGANNFQKKKFKKNFKQKKNSKKNFKKKFKKNFQKKISKKISKKKI